MKKLIKSLQSFSSTQNVEDTRKFNQVLDWWKPSGSMRVLWQYNYVRVKYMHQMLKISQKQNSLKDLQILDAGCGGGILSESLARLGGNVTAIDISEMSIQAAQQHKPSYLNNLQYVLSTPEKLENVNYDMITSMEVLEHVKEKELFVKSLSKLLKKDGLLFMSTIDRSLESYLKVIIGAEYITGIVPRDTHDWNLFITPYELQNLLEKHDLKVKNIQGVEFNLIEGTMKYSSNKMNYMLTAQKL